MRSELPCTWIGSVLLLEPGYSIGGVTLKERGICPFDRVECPGGDVLGRRIELGGARLVSPHAANMRRRSRMSCAPAAARTACPSPPPSSCPWRRPSIRMTTRHGRIRPSCLPPGHRGPHAVERNEHVDDELAHVVPPFWSAYGQLSPSYKPGLLPSYKPPAFRRERAERAVDFRPCSPATRAVPRLRGVWRQLESLPQRIGDDGVEEHGGAYPEVCTGVCTRRAFPTFPGTLDRMVERNARSDAGQNGPGRDRTCDLGIKSPLLYQLSYRP